MSMLQRYCSNVVLTLTCGVGAGKGLEALEELSHPSQEAQAGQESGAAACVVANHGSMERQSPQDTPGQGFCQAAGPQRATQARHLVCPVLSRSQLAEIVATDQAAGLHVLEPLSILRTVTMTTTTIRIIKIIIIIIVIEMRVSQG